MSLYVIGLIFAKIQCIFMINKHFFFSTLFRVLQHSYIGGTNRLTEGFSRERKSTVPLAVNFNLSHFPFAFHFCVKLIIAPETPVLGAFFSVPTRLSIPGFDAVTSL